MVRLGPVIQIDSERLSACFRALCVARDELGVERCAAKGSPKNNVGNSSRGEPLVLSTNTAIVAFHESFGFRQVTHVREHDRHGAELIDVVGLALLQSDWERHRPVIELRMGLLPAEGEGK